MSLAVIPFIVAIIGLFMYFFAFPAKVQQVGLALFTAGMVALMIAWSHVSVHLG